MPTYHDLLTDETLKTPQELFTRRVHLIQEIEKKTERPLIIYASDFLKLRHVPSPNGIDDSDILGFSDLIKNLEGENLDVLIHSPGGLAESAERIVNLLRAKFKEIRYFIPHSAYSAATLITLSGDKILMDARSALGPIDPQILDTFTGKYVPSQAVLEGFKKARKTMEKEGYKAMPVYLPLLSKYDFTIFEICENAIKLSKQLALEWLIRYMKLDKKKAAKIANYFLSTQKTHFPHRRGINIEKAKEVGLKVEDLSKDSELSEKIWTLYCLLDIFFDRTLACKTFENSRGISWSRFLPSPQPPLQMQLPLPGIQPPLPEKSTM